MHNPLRSERDAFRLVLVVAAAGALVIAAGLIIGPLAGLIVLGLELGVGIGLIWRSSRGSLPQQPRLARADDGVYRLLVIANETVGGRSLLGEIERRCSGRRSEILVVAPPHTHSRAEHLASDVDEAIREAEERLRASLRTMRERGLAVEGRVGDHHDPTESLEDALREFAASEVIISTHPPERSRWLEWEVVDRARRDLPLTVTHVVVDLEAEAREAAGLGAGGSESVD
jgi:GABA permease